MKKLAQSKELIKEYLPKSEHFIVTKKIDEPEELLPDIEEKKSDLHHHEHTHEHHKSKDQSFRFEKGVIKIHII